jgi:hypothetical protein
VKERREKERREKERRGKERRGKERKREGDIYSDQSKECTGSALMCDKKSR